MKKSYFFTTFFGPGRLGALILFLSLTVGLGEVLAQRSMTEDYERAPNFKIPTIQPIVGYSLPLGDGESSIDFGVFGYVKLSKTLAIRPGVDLLILGDETYLRLNGGLSWFLPFSTATAWEVNGNIGYLSSLPQARSDASPINLRFNTNILFGFTGIGIFVTSIFDTASGGFQFSYVF